MLVGMVLSLKGMSVFAKMTGPEAEVKTETGNFQTFCSSIEFVSPQADPHAGHQHDHEHEKNSSNSSGKINWTAPENWSEVSGNPSRLVTFKTGSCSEAECYITVFPGTAGGEMSNINRWFRQMGQQALSGEELNKLPTITVFGNNSKLVDIVGVYTSMQGETKSSQALLGTIGQHSGNSVFIKMVGPQPCVDRERSNFIALCKSLK